MRFNGFLLQLFADNAFDGGAYCDFSSSAAKALAGKDILLAVYNADGSKLIAIGGQKGLTINRSADSIEITSKDTAGGWKSKIAGMKEWSIDNDGLYVPGDEAHSIWSESFVNSAPVCIKVIDGKRKRGMFGGLAVITDYPLEAPYDDAMTYSLSLEGMGALLDLLTNKPALDIQPGNAVLDVLTVVSVAGSSAGNTAVYVNPAREAGNTYRYSKGSAAVYPSYDDDCTSMDTWDGEAELAAVSGERLLIVECTSEGKARKAGIATVTIQE